MLGSILFVLAIAFVFIVIFIRPQQRRNRELQAMQSSLNVGDVVMLTSGIHGTLREITDDTVLLDIADGVTVTVARGAVGQTVAPTTSPDDDATPTRLDQVEPEEI